MVQNLIKILTLGFFFSMITGFVMYRSGYFDSEKTTYALQSSPNGGELNSVQTKQDSTKIPEINQNNQAPIMPSSKSGRAFDLEKYENAKRKERLMPSSKSGRAFDLEVTSESLKEEMKKAILPSSKSLLHPIEFSTETKQEMMSSSKSIIISDPYYPSLSNREAIKVQPELEPKDSLIGETEAADETEFSIEGAKREATSETETTVINWRAIWIGVLGILFVAIGSIVYFKRRSK